METVDTYKYASNLVDAFVESIENAKIYYQILLL